MVLDMTFEAKEKMIKQDSYDNGFNDGFNDGAKSRQEEIDSLQKEIEQLKQLLKLNP
ncbi:MAG: hypothetical protein MJ105_09960 [Lachnospiraceae bacterium]|nr:hypothetical protein [Lachnospiraceae bacterium]